MLYYPVGLDFDGTVVEHDYPDIGREIPGAVNWIKRWVEAGARIMLITMRHGETLNAAVTFLQVRDVPLYGINHNPDQASWTQSPKIYAATYVDDSAIGCPLVYPASGKRPYVDWNVVGPAVLTRIQGKVTPK